MDKTKKKISGATLSITFIILAAVLAESAGVVQYIYTRREITRQATYRTHRTLKEVQRISMVKTSVETAVQATIGEVERNLDTPAEFTNITIRLVNSNKYINGSAVALKPNYYADKDRLYAPFAFQEDERMRPQSKLIPYDYTTMEWYKLAYKSDSAQWSQPYSDVGGSNLLIYTYSHPIHDDHKHVVGVFTADVSFKEFAFNSENYESFDHVHFWVFILQMIGIAMIIYIVWRSASNIRKVNKLITEQHLLMQELQIASDIQTAMLPANLVQENARHHLDVQVELLSATDVGADFYDYFYVGHSLVFCVGDVPGSNVRASLMMAVTRSVFRTAAMPVGTEKTTTTPSPAAIVKAMNNSLSSISDNQMFSTLVVGVLDLDNARFSCCSAGHPAPILLSPVTGARLMDVAPNIPIGVLPDFDYTEQRITLIDDFTIFVYTDGVYETENGRHETFGMKRMMARLEASAKNEESPARVIGRLKEGLKGFSGETLRQDDAVMVAIKTV